MEAMRSTVPGARGAMDILGARATAPPDTPGGVAQALAMVERARERLGDLRELVAALEDYDRRRRAALPARVPARGKEAGGEPLTPEQRLVGRITLGANALELARIEEVGYQRYLDEQLAYEEIDDGGLEEILVEHLPTLAMQPVEILVNHYEQPAVPIIHLWLATLFRALYSPRQLFESMTVLWSDHFNIDIASDLGFFLKPVDDREVVRRHAMGTFPELLAASAHSPAMLSYLTNDSNHREHPNENYSRELMELHTVGADNGYTQEDVREVARCFTGWTLWGERGGVRIGTFRFDPRAHDFAAKTVLGQTIPAGGGIEDGERVLEILAAHPNTARFVAEKTLRFFWGYEPEARHLDLVAKKYLDTGGDLREMLRVALRRRWIKDAPPKLKRPYRLVISALRSLFAGLREPFFVIEELARMGQLPFRWEPPNGYPDSRGYWGGFLLPRWNFATRLVAGDRAAAEVDLPFLDPALLPWELVEGIDWLLSGHTLSDATRRALVRFLRGHRNPERIREALGLALASPELQEF